MPDNSSRSLSRQGHRLVQLGVALSLFVTLQGLVIQSFAVPSLGRSAHTLSLSSGTPFQETTISVVLVSTLPTGIIAFAPILWGLRGLPST